MLNELDKNFPILSQIKNPLTNLEVKTLTKFNLNSRKQILLSEIIKRNNYLGIDFEPEFNFLDPDFSLEETPSFHDLVWNLKNSKQEISNFYPPDSKVERFFSRQELNHSMIAALKNAFPFPLEAAVEDSELCASIAVGDWSLEIVIEVDYLRQLYSCDYWIDSAIGAQDARLLRRVISFPGCIGLFGDITWPIEKREELQGIVDAIALSCRKLFDFLNQSAPALDSCSEIKF